MTSRNTMAEVKIRNNIASVHVTLNEYDEAETLYRLSLDLMNKYPQDTDEYHYLMEKTLSSLAGVLARQQKYHEAQIMYRQSLDLMDKHPLDIDTDHHLMAETLNGLASVLAHQQKHYEAEKLFLRTLEIYRKQEQEDPGEWDFVIAFQFISLATAIQYQHRHDEANDLYNEALSILLRLVKDCSMPTDTIGMIVEGIRFICEYLLTQNSENNHYLADACNELGGYYLYAKESAPEAEFWFRKSLSIYRMVFKSDASSHTVKMMLVCGNLAKLLQNQNRDYKIDADIKETIDLYNSTYETHNEMMEELLLV